MKSVAVRRRLVSIWMESADAAIGQEAHIVNILYLTLLDSPWKPGVISAARLAELRSTAAHEQAVIELVQPGWGYILSKGPNGTCMASVSLHEEARESTVFAASAGLALTGALASALANTLLPVDHAKGVIQSGEPHRT